MASDESEKRESVMVNLTPAAKAKFDAWVDATGVRKTWALERILDWFFAQPDNVRAAIIARQYDPSAKAQVESADLAELVPIMKAVAARFDAFIAEAKRPPRQGVLKESGRSAPPRGK